LKGVLTSPAARLALPIAALMMAWQVAAKGTRDSLFLWAFQPEDLPVANVGAAVCSILLAIGASRLMRYFSPSRVIPGAYVFSTLLHAAEWALLPSSPRAVSAFTYVHIIALGPVLLTGFWSLASERFDPREARRRFGQITAFGTIGAVTGPLVAERVAQFTSTNDLLLFLALLQIVCFPLVLTFGAGWRGEEEEADSASILKVLAGSPHLLRLALFVVLITMSAATLDYLFKVQVYGAFAAGQPRTRFFLLFNAVTAALSFAAQAALSGLWLRRFGPGRTVSVLPLAVGGASAASMFLPGAAPLIVTRALEQLLRGSLFRSGYELFYTPMPPDEKRAAKPVIDIGADRSGDLLANTLIQVLLVMPAAVSFRVILALTTALAAAAAWLALRLDRAYVTVLEKGLLHQTGPAAPEDGEDFLTSSTVLRTMPGLGTSLYLAPELARETLSEDPVVRRLADLRSGQASRVRAALSDRQPLAPALVAETIELLGRDEVARPAHEALVRVAPNAAGQLVDYLLNPANNPRARRRVPRILVTAGNALAWEGLMCGLRDQSFEIRLRCARGLEKMLERNPHFKAEEAAVFAAVSRELARLRLGPESSSPESAGAPAAPPSADDERDFLVVDEVLRERASERLTYLATLLGLVLPPQSVRLAFRALHTDQAKLRGVALEYLDSVLPQALRVQFAALFETGLPAVGQAPPARSGEALAHLVDASPSILARLKDMGFDPQERGEPGAASASKDR
jgi:AAA family ATP:ADP antiporter